MFPGCTRGSGLEGVPYPPHGPRSTLTAQPVCIAGQLVYGIQSRAHGPRSPCRRGQCDLTSHVVGGNTVAGQPKSCDDWP